ncbi:MAG: fibronectin type III domain-containing protein, partial [bacterium]
LNAASGGVPGVFAYTPSGGTVLPVGNGQTLSVQFTPADTSAYTAPAAKAVTINVIANTLFNVSASDLTRTSAVVTASLACPGAAYDVCAFWNTVNGETDPARWTNSAYAGSWTNVASTNISFTAAGLTPGTAYFFTFRATNAVYSLWATNVLGFMTTANPASYTITQSVGTNGSANPAGEVTVLAGNSTSIIYTADQWFRVAALTNDEALIDVAAGAITYTNSFNNVATNHDVKIAFKAAEPEQTGLGVPTDWVAGYYATEGAAKADADLATDYLLGLDPTVGYAIGFTISAVTVNSGEITVVVVLKNGGSPIDTTINGTLKLQGKNALADADWTDIGAATISNASFNAAGMCSVSFADAAFKFYRAVIMP